MFRSIILGGLLTATIFPQIPGVGKTFVANWCDKGIVGLEMVRAKMRGEVAVPQTKVDKAQLPAKALVQSHPVTRRSVIVYARSATSLRDSVYSLRWHLQSYLNEASEDLNFTEMQQLNEVKKQLALLQNHLEMYPNMFGIELGNAYANYELLRQQVGEATAT